jgi:hypothetical protein
MSDFLPTIQPKDGLGSTINKVINHAKSNTLQSSKDLRVTKNSSGTTIQLADHLKHSVSAIWNWKSGFDPDAGYNPFDVIRVSDDQAYTTYTSASVSPTAGTWICVAAVPNLRNSDAYKSVGQTQGPAIRQDGVDYFPIDPEPSVLQEDVRDEPDPVIKATIRYWEQIGNSSAQGRWA